MKRTSPFAAARIHLSIRFAEPSASPTLGSKLAPSLASAVRTDATSSR